MDELVAGIRRVTLPLPPARERPRVPVARRRRVDRRRHRNRHSRREGHLARGTRARTGRVAAVFVTHFHPDHVGAKADLHELTGAPVSEARSTTRSASSCGGTRTGRAAPGWFQLHGAPDDVTAELVGQSSRYRPFIRYQQTPSSSRRASASTAGSSSRPRARRRTALSDQGRRPHRCRPSPPEDPRQPSASGRRAAPTHSATSSRSLERTAALGARVALPGTVSRSRIRPRGPGAQNITVCGSENVAALGDEPRTGYELSFALFGDDLKPACRRFAVAETLSHAERLVNEGSARAQARGRQHRFLYCGLIDGGRPPA